MMATRTLQEPMYERIAENVWMVGGAECSHPEDCGVFAVNLGALILVDAGCGPGWPRIRENLRAAGLAPAAIDTLILTHCHVDHVGAAGVVHGETGCRIVCHDGDAEAIESGDTARTAADWYGIRLRPLPVDLRVAEEYTVLPFPEGELHLLHTPGHTPGSMVAWLDTPDAGRVIFGQDIHGPFHQQFGSDIDAWRASMRRLLDLEADILCEGHYGVFWGKDRVAAFIKDQLRRF